MSTRRNLYLIAAILLTAAGLYAAGLLTNRRPAAYVTVSVDGEEIARFDLNETTDYLIPGYAGGSNRLIVRDGQAWIEEASCPDKLCVQQGRIHRAGEMIICLPNRVVAEVSGQSR